MNRTSTLLACALHCAVAAGGLSACSDDDTSETPTTAGSGGAGSAGNGAQAGTSGPKAGAGGSGKAGSSAPQAGTNGAQAGTGDSDKDGGQDTTEAYITERSSVPPVSAPVIEAADYETFITGINTFGLELGQAMSTSNQFDDKNVVYSPLSVSSALSMLYAGARAGTESEIKTVLHDTLSAGQFHVGANRLARDLAALAVQNTSADGKTRKVELNLANALFLEQSLSVQSAFLDLLSQQYDTGLNKADFVHAFEPARIAINDWVSDQTKTRITDLLPQGSITEDTRFVLVNALYFYGSWAQPFMAGATRDRPFHTLAGAEVQASTMHSSDTFAYRAGGDFALAEFPYEGRDLVMTVVLPTDGKFAEVRKSVSQAWLAQATTGVQPTRLAVALPKFEMTVGSFDLTQGLDSLGMKQAFTGTADFTGIAAQGGLSVSAILQKAFIRVDEDGTEAAAATGVIGGVTSAPAEPTPFVVDRPFLYFIRDTKSKAVLFSGQVVDPSQK